MSLLRTVPVPGMRVIIRRVIFESDMIDTTYERYHLPQHPNTKSSHPLYSPIVDSRDEARSMWSQSVEPCLYLQYKMRREDFPTGPNRSVLHHGVLLVPTCLRVCFPLQMYMSSIYIELRTACTTCLAASSRSPFRRILFFFFLMCMCVCV